MDGRFESKSIRYAHRIPVTTYFLQMSGMDVVKSIEVTMIGISLALPATVISWYTMIKFGRSFIHLISFITVGTLWFSIGIAGIFLSSGIALL